MVSSWALASFTLAALGKLAAAKAFPNMTFDNVLFQDQFNGWLPGNWIWDVGHQYVDPATGAVGPDRWGVQEFQRYTNSNRNTKLMYEYPEHFVRITPYLGGEEKKVWVSGRIESKATIASVAGRVTEFSAKIRLQDAPQGTLNGMHPAVWLLGADYREAPFVTATEGKYWNHPAVGELDMMENRRGESTISQTAHCTGCQIGEEFLTNGNNGGAPITRGQWFVVSMQVDRSSTPETITWFVDGKQTFQISQDDPRRFANRPESWAAVAYSRFFFLLNVAVGGHFGGNVDPNTTGGVNASMDVSYVKVATN